MEGDLAYYDPADVVREIEHRYPLFGIRSSYQVEAGPELYAGWSQAYRPQILKDVLPGNALERTDPNLSDSRGWTLEAGIRGTLGQRLGYDMSVFQMRMEVGRASANLLLSYVDKSFSDPVNTIIPSPNGAVGLVPAHTLVDLNMGFEGTEWLRIRAGINNLFDRRYFTKRPQFYPGPGVWPSDGRSFQLSADLSFWR